MDPELIDPHWDKRGCLDWHEYARQFRSIHVEAKPCGIGNLFTAYLPSGYKFTTADLAVLQESLHHL